MTGIETTPIDLIFWTLTGYFLGAIPFGLVVTRVMGLTDPRKIGSGNIGATNVLRTGSKAAGAATLILDAAKGALVVVLARWAEGPAAAQLVALAAFVGHCYPIWLNFRGGKGVATFLGVLLALAWPVGLAALALWIGAAVLFRMSSLAALLSATATLALVPLTGFGELALVTALMVALVFWRHRENIQRLRLGTEPRIGKKR